MNLDNLLTETINPATVHIDQESTLGMLTLINKEDQKVALAIEKILPQIAEAVDIIAAALKSGGRLFYLGAGTSGRLGILDASECPPTYGTDPGLVQGLIAGGKAAVFHAVEGAEDSESLGRKDLEDRQLTKTDVVVGIAASGRTPYVIGGLTFAKSFGCKTISLSSSPASAIGKLADISLTVLTGSEVIMGSTRMKAGTAQKLVLNMLTTGTMIKLGKVYGNLMVDVQSTNEKLKVRATRIVTTATGCTAEEAKNALHEAEGSCKLAITMLLTDLTAPKAAALLEAAGGYITKALALKKNC